MHTQKCPLFFRQLQERLPVAGGLNLRPDRLAEPGPLHRQAARVRHLRRHVPSHPLQLPQDPAPLPHHALRLLALLLHPAPQRHQRLQLDHHLHGPHPRPGHRRAWRGQPRHRPVFRQAARLLHVRGPDVHHHSQPAYRHIHRRDQECHRAGGHAAHRGEDQVHAGCAGELLQVLGRRWLVRVRGGAEGLRGVCAGEGALAAGVHVARGEREGGEGGGWGAGSRAGAEAGAGRERLEGGEEAAGARRCLSVLGIVVSERLVLTKIKIIRLNDDVLN